MRWLVVVLVLSSQGFSQVPTRFSSLGTVGKMDEYEFLDASCNLEAGDLVVELAKAGDEGNIRLLLSRFKSVWENETVWEKGTRVVFILDGTSRSSLKFTSRDGMNWQVSPQNHPQSHCQIIVTREENRLEGAVKCRHLFPERGFPSNELFTQEKNPISCEIS